MSTDFGGLPGLQPRLEMDIGPLLSKLSVFVSELGRKRSLQTAFLRDPAGTLVSQGLAPPADAEVLSTKNRLTFSLLANRTVARLLVQELAEAPLPRGLSRSLVANTRNQVARDRGDRLEFRKDLTEQLLRAEVGDADRLRALLRTAFEDENIREMLGVTPQEGDRIITRIVREFEKGTPLDRLGVLARVGKDGKSIIASGAVVGDDRVEITCIGILFCVVLAVNVKTAVNVNSAANVNVTANVNANVNSNVSAGPVT
jgi:hypothetical protein